MLVLERTATYLADGNEPVVLVKAQPFGGAVQLSDPGKLQSQIGHFHFDSHRSRQELDFRLQIRPADWETVRRWCVTHLGQATSKALDASPLRELAEELGDCLKGSVPIDAYTIEPARLIIEDGPMATTNIRARQQPTARIYRTFIVQVIDPSLVNTLLINSANYSDQDLERLAMQDSETGGKGRANAALVLPLAPLVDVYRALPSPERRKPILFQMHRLAGNVYTILDEIAIL